ncbi:MAG: hypothetical protein HYT13_01935 [Candidatus Liptonbacteria bacterium]|nr:hypothetical protein [Candidatus Liptonbacteria bacterium]
MTPKSFLKIGGIVLVVVGILGFFVIGPTPDASVFGSAWWFDNGENWAHILFGVVALVAITALKNEAVQKKLVMLVGILALLVGVYGFFNANFLGANLENPLDNLLHLAVGAWALMSIKGKKMMMAGEMHDGMAK